jgi:hypothetical protein
MAEHTRLSELDRDNLPKLKDVNEIKPLSDELKKWFPMQWAIYKERNGLVDETTE